MDQEKIRGLTYEIAVVDDLADLEEAGEIALDEWERLYIGDEERSTIQGIIGQNRPITDAMFDAIESPWVDFKIEGLPEPTQQEIDRMNVRASAEYFAPPQNRAQRRARNSQLRKMEVKGRKFK